jgi:site-specific DNA recombinase
MYDAPAVVARAKRANLKPVIHLAQVGEAKREQPSPESVLRVPWRKTASTRRREILLPTSIPSKRVRPIRAETRATLVSSIARARRWLDELMADPSASIERIAQREGCSVRKVNMTISLAFLAPDLVRAAIDGRLPHGMGVSRLCELPAEWLRQHRMLGFSAP